MPTNGFFSKTEVSKKGGSVEVVTEVAQAGSALLNRGAYRVFKKSLREAGYTATPIEIDPNTGYFLKARWDKEGLAGLIVDYQVPLYVSKRTGKQVTGKRVSLAS